MPHPAERDLKLKLHYLRGKLPGTEGHALQRPLRTTWFTIKIKVVGAKSMEVCCSQATGDREEKISPRHRSVY